MSAPGTGYAAQVWADNDGSKVLSAGRMNHTESWLDILEGCTVKDLSQSGKLGDSNDLDVIQAHIQALGTDAGMIILPNIPLNIPADIVISNPTTFLVGGGPSSELRGTTGFAGNSLVTINNADNCGVLRLNLRGAHGTGNPAGGGIKVTQSRNFRMGQVMVQYLNGWGLEVIGTDTMSSFGAMLSDVYMLHTIGGIHGKATGGGSSNYGFQFWASGLNLEVIDGLPGLWLEDCSDITISNFGGANSQGSGGSAPMVLLEGRTNSCFMGQIDLGVYPGPATGPVMLLKPGVNGAPSGINLNGGVLQGGTANLRVEGGGDIKSTGITFKLAAGSAVELAGSPIIRFTGCSFGNANRGASTTAADPTYEIDASAMTGGFAYVNGSEFTTALQTSANIAANTAAGNPGTLGLISNPIADPNDRTVIRNNDLRNSGLTPATVFATGGAGRLARGNTGLNPYGTVTAPTIPASGTTGTINGPFDLQVTFNTVPAGTTFSYNGSPAFTPALGSTIMLPVGTTFVFTYTTAPTWFAVAN